MAIVQVSRITNRKGLTEDLPQLAGAELGWCLDSRRLFIGNGTLQDGAPVIGNTEILTEFSDIVAVSAYTYRDSVVGYTAQTGPTPSDPVIRTVQQKLDDFADVRDFGAVGDGIADDTAAINRALYQLYCRENNSLVRRTLYFPAGTYKVTESIIIPTYAKLVGEGANCSIIKLEVSGDISSLSAYVARYGDSLQQTGVNIGNNGAITPRNIEISSMTFQTGEFADIFLVQDAFQCWFDSVNFVGPFTSSDIIDPGFLPLTTDNLAGVRFDSTEISICDQITFDKCKFSNLAYGINTDNQIQGVTVSNSMFDTLYQGIVLGTGTVINGGATGFRAVQNIFDNIYAQGIVYGDVNLNASAHNVFYNVGNSIGAGPTSAIITFDNDNSVSIGDLFERSDNDDNIEARIQITGTTNTSASDIGNNPGTLLQVGRYARLVGRTFTVGDAQSNQNIFSVGTDNFKAWKMDYTISRGGEVRTGAIVCTTDTSVVNYADDYSETGSTGVTLTPFLNGSSVTVKYTSTSIGSPGTLTYSIAHLA